MPSAQAVIAISPNAFLVVWWLSLLVHIICILYAVSVISIHRYIIAQNLQVIVDYLGHNAFSFFQFVLVAMYCVIACHAAEILRVVLCSLHARECRFTKKTRSVPSTAPRSTTTTTTRVAGKALEYRGPTATAIPRTQWINRLYTTLSARYEEYSLTGPKYDSAYFVFEVIEITLQTYQAYKLSGLVPAVWINRLYAIVIVSNCWSTAIVHKYLHAHQLAKRVLLMFVDSLFDVVTNLIIPFVIFVPYYWEFDLALRDFPMVNYYNDGWLIQAISENQQVFVTSWLDYVSKMSPHFSVFAAVVMLKQTIARDTSTQYKSRAKVTATTPTPKPSRLAWPRWRSLMPTASTQVRRGSTLSHLVKSASGLRPRASFQLTTSQRFAVTRLFTSRPNILHDLFFVVFGIAILVIHLHTTYVAVSTTTTGCMLAMRPWLATEPTCASMEINCAHGQHDYGRDAASFYKVLTSVEPQSLKALVLSGCANLHMPPAIQLLPALLMLKIYNSTIDQWDVRAELHNAHHPNLLMVYSCDTNYSSGELPVGILGDTMPFQLVDVEFSGSNLVQLPTDLATKWPSIMYFVLERSPGITAFPEVLVQMHIPQLMVGENSIHSIPDALLADQAFWKLMLDGNPLQHLPHDIGTVQDLYKVGFAYTQVTTFPAWAIANASIEDRDVPFLGYVDVYAGGSPLCETYASTAATVTLKEWVHLDCTLDAPTHAYPVESERSRRAAVQVEHLREG